MKIAFSTLGCPGWSWDEIFATAKDLGLDGIEVRGVENQMFAPEIKAFSGEQLTHTKARLKKAGMELPMLSSGVCLGMAGDTAHFVDEAKDYINFASQIGTPFVRVMISPLPEPTEQENIWQAKELYTKLCSYARGKNVSVLIETNGKLAQSKVMRDFMQGIDPETGGVLWDLHHPYRYFGETPAQTYENIGQWVKYMHVKDSVVQNDKIVYRMMGYGDVPVFDAVKLLDTKGYTGYVTLEWVKRWCPDLQEPGIVFAHFANYMAFLRNQLK
ncbi:sugar phosphate isomerase/epimerase family protein [Oscillospiraceae bacterium PP1C4]